MDNIAEGIQVQHTFSTLYKYAKIKLLCSLTFQPSIRRGQHHQLIPRQLHEELRSLQRYRPIKLSNHEGSYLARQYHIMSARITYEFFTRLWHRQLYNEQKLYERNKKEDI